ncbi:MAG: LacI family DNA-binding transcriptional regulator [Armatimonas sp.]
MENIPTLQDVAKALGVHKSTVSLALSGKGNLSHATRVRIQTMAKEMGYEANPIAQRLAGRTTRPLVCLFVALLDMGLSTEKAIRLQRALTAEGFDAPLYTDLRLVRAVRRLRPQAIVCATQFTDESLYSELRHYQQSGGVVVSYDTPIPLECDQVLFDREHNSYEAMSYLIRQGHRRIALALPHLSISPHAPIDSSDPRTHRMRGFLKALDEHGLTLPDEWLALSPPYEQGGTVLAEWFLGLKERPSAMAIVNDYVALGLMSELGRAGISLPDDLSIIGHDNQAIAAYCPVPLTTMTQPVAEIAATIVERLRARFEGDDSPPQTTVLRGNLVVRESVVPAK